MKPDTYLVHSATETVYISALTHVLESHINGQPATMQTVAVGGVASKIYYNQTKLTS
jgi:hypothetical protein